MGEWEEHLNLLQEQIDPRAWPSSSSGNPDPSPPHTTYPGQAATNHWPSALQTQDLNYSHTHTETWFSKVSLMKQAGLGTFVQLSKRFFSMFPGK